VRGSAEFASSSFLPIRSHDRARCQAEILLSDLCSFPEPALYVPQAQYQSRYPAMVHENIELNFYYFTNGKLPRLNERFN
jgi:hypothetical protein